MGLVAILKAQGRQDTSLILGFTLFIAISSSGAGFLDYYFVLILSSLSSHVMCTKAGHRSWLVRHTDLYYSVLTGV